MKIKIRSISSDGKSEKRGEMELSGNRDGQGDMERSQNSMSCFCRA